MKDKKKERMRWYIRIGIVAFLVVIVLLGFLAQGDTIQDIVEDHGCDFVVKTERGFDGCDNSAMVAELAVVAKNKNETGVVCIIDEMQEFVAECQI